MRIKIVLSVLVMLAGAAACTRTDSVGPTPEGGTQADINTGGRQDGKAAAVTISPPEPNSTCDLQAIYRGSGGTPVYRWYRNGELLKEATTPFLAKGNFSKGDKVTLMVDAGGMESSASAVIKNCPPKVTSVPFSPQLIHAGVDITVSPVAVDPDGDRVDFRYQWYVNGVEQPERSPVFKGSSFKKGDSVVVAVTPYDAEGEGETFKGLPLVIPNGYPRFVSHQAHSFSGGVFRYRAEAVDPDGDPLVYSLASAPAGMQIDPQRGDITWVVGKERGGWQEFEVVALDGEGAKAVLKYRFEVVNQ